MNSNANEVLSQPQYAVEIYPIMKKILAFSNPTDEEDITAFWNIGILRSGILSYIERLPTFDYDDLPKMILANAISHEVPSVVLVLFFPLSINELMKTPKRFEPILETTARLIYACSIFKVSFVDLMIINTDGYFSLAEDGVLERLIPAGGDTFRPSSPRKIRPPGCKEKHGVTEEQTEK